MGDHHKYKHNRDHNRTTIANSTTHHKFKHTTSVRHDLDHRYKPNRDYNHNHKNNHNHRHMISHCNIEVSAAAGAVGSTVAQIAKIMGCRVVGIAGGPDKVNFLVSSLGLDAGIDYKEFDTQDKMQKELARVCPSGIDIYYDNVGGYISDSVYPLINLRARIIICGQITQYNGNLDNPMMGPRFLHHILYKRATIQGILSRDYSSRHGDMVEKIVGWMNEGKIKPYETVVEGFENIPNALNSLFHGKNVGKMVVKV